MTPRILAKTAASAAIFVAACSGPEDDPSWTGALETDGGADEALTAPDWDHPQETADTEDADPLLLPAGYCIQIPEAPIYGYRHQCSGHIQISFKIDDNALDANITFGPGATNPDLWVDPDGYELPLVAACCGAYDYDAPTSEEKKPYAINCLADGVQQVCGSLPHIIRREAATKGPATQAVTLGLADSLEETPVQADCWASLWGDLDPEVDPWNQISDTSWSPKDNATITLNALEVTDWTEEGDVTWQTCEGWFDNDAAVVPTAPLTVPGTVAMRQGILASGSSAAGTGPLSSSATLYPTSGSFTLAQDLSSGTVLVTALSLAAGSTTIVSGGDAMVLERSSMVLRKVLEPSISAGDYVVPAGSAMFTVMTTYEGGSRIIPFTNTDAIYFRSTSTGWEIDPFEIVYAEPGVGTWSLDFDGLTFYLPTSPRYSRSAPA